MPAARDLNGLTVVCVEQAVAAPYASSRLADAGARVIKIERPEGDFARGYDKLVKGESAYFVWLNRGKESIRLDLSDPADKAVLDAMILAADVFIQNLAPGAISRLGFGPGDLRRRNPRLITCSISGYGDSGPRAGLKAYDLLVQGETGLSAITGNEHGMARTGVSVCDIAAGMTAHAAILQALIGRGITGQGRHVAVSLFHALADWMNVPYMQFEYGGVTPARSGLSHPTVAPYGAFPCRDGRLLLISIQNEREWKVFAGEILGDAALAGDPRFNSNPARINNRIDLDDLVAGIFIRHDREDMAARLEAARIAYGRVAGIDELDDHPQNRFIDVKTPAGTIRHLSPGALHDGEIYAAGTVPALGAHDAALREEFTRRR